MNDSGEIRTHDRPLRRRMLYPAELPNHRNVIYYTTWKSEMSNKIYEKIVKRNIRPSKRSKNITPTIPMQWAPDEPACFERFDWSSQHRWQRFLGRCFGGGPQSGRTKLKINAWNWRDSGTGKDKSRTHFVLNGRKCCRYGRSFWKFRRGHDNDVLVQRKYFRTEEKYRSFQDLIKFFNTLHFAGCFCVSGR